MARIIKKYSPIETSLLKARHELEDLLKLIKSWRLNGIYGSGVIPIAILPLEARLEKSIEDINSMIKIISS